MKKIGCLFFRGFRVGGGWRWAASAGFRGAAVFLSASAASARGGVRLSLINKNIS